VLDISTKEKTKWYHTRASWQCAIESNEASDDLFTYITDVMITNFRSRSGVNASVKKQCTFLR